MKKVNKKTPKIRRRITGSITEIKKIGKAPKRRVRVRVRRKPIKLDSIPMELSGSKLTQKLLRALDISIEHNIQPRSGILCVSWRVIAAKLIGIARDIDKGRKFRNIPYGILTDLYIIASFLYYRLDEPIMSDSRYDALCSYLYEHFDKAKREAYHPQCLDEDALEVGTGYHVKTPPTLQFVAQEALVLLYRQDYGHRRRSSRRVKVQGTRNLLGKKSKHIRRRITGIKSKQIKDNDKTSIKKATRLSGGHRVRPLRKKKSQVSTDT